ncbi:hypothetical protein BC826DRAFT_1013007 [Russula brevipes]|nr:hypothetical protein BC826DRAFT_1013007 [Russula brevipes]
MLCCCALPFPSFACIPSLVCGSAAHVTFLSFSSRLVRRPARFLILSSHSFLIFSYLILSTTSPGLCSHTRIYTTVYCCQRPNDPFSMYVLNLTGIVKPAVTRLFVYPMLESAACNVRFVIGRYE